VSVGDCCAAAVLFEEAVVQEAAERLREEDEEEHDTDDRVGVAEVLAIDGDPDSYAEGYEVNQEADDLQSSVHPDEAGEAGCTDKDSADGEEGDEGERGHYAMGEQHCLARAAEGAVAAVLRELGV
jgi:hypothetical protein